jgi:4a-hydroxytetrahydrobiopterin dehydratase
MAGMTALHDRTCHELPKGTPPLSADDTARLLEELGNGWTVFENRLRKAYSFPSFATALAFVNKVGAIADEQNHHPDVMLSWGKAVVELWTHTVDGLSENDFICAARFDRALDV